MTNFQNFNENQAMTNMPNECSDAVIVSVVKEGILLSVYPEGYFAGETLINDTDTIESIRTRISEHKDGNTYPSSQNDYWQGAFMSLHNEAKQVHSDVLTDENQQAITAIVARIRQDELDEFEREKAVAEAEAKKILGDFYKVS